MISRSKAALAASTTCLMAAGIGAGSAQAGPFLSPVASLATTAEAVNGDVALVKGTFTDKQGKPIPGPITVVAMPDDMKKWNRYPVVATGVADSTGAFSATVSDLATINALAAEQDGRLVDFEVTSDVFGTEGAAILSRRVQGTPEHPVLVDPDAPDLATRAALKREPETVAITSSWLKGTGDTATRLGKPKQQCMVRWPIEPTEVKSVENYTVIGELNNAYNDGTTAQFQFTLGRDSAAKIGIATSVNGVDYDISEEKSFETEDTAVFPKFEKRMARKLQSKFEYTRTRRERRCPDEPVQYKDDIRATDWKRGARYEVKQPGALDKCRLSEGEWGGGSKFIRRTKSAVRWNTGVKAFGVGLTSQAGYSEGIKTTFVFGGGPKKQHRVCGDLKGQDAYESGRVFSGSLK